MGSRCRFWKHKWNVSNAAHATLAPSLVAGGAFAAVEVEYRRGFDETRNAGFPATQNDVAAALACLPQIASAHRWPLDFEKLVLLGHSAGGHLALLAADAAAKRRWPRQLHAAPEKDAAAPAEEAAALRLQQRRGAAAAVVVPRLVVAVAPVADLVAAFHRKLSDERRCRGAVHARQPRARRKQPANLAAVASGEPGPLLLAAPRAHVAGVRRRRRRRADGPRSALLRPSRSRRTRNRQPKRKRSRKRKRPKYQHGSCERKCRTSKRHGKAMFFCGGERSALFGVQPKRRPLRAGRRRERRLGAHPRVYRRRSYQMAVKR